MHAQQFPHKVTLQRPQRTVSASGGVQSSWATVARPWANVSLPSGSETVRSDVPVGITRASIRLLGYRADVDATWRVLHGADVYAVKSALPDERRRQYVDLVCEKGQSNG